jgi:two-component sensor histidine kinase/DNA-binding response OmpR family regulator
MTPQDKVNILLVDDQPAKLLSYEVILGELGENLIKAGSARQALEHLLKTEIAVVLVDVVMPELDGFQLAAMIREHPRFQKTAIIFISAIQVEDVDRLRGYEIGAVDYVPVPVIPEVLRAKVRVFAELYRKTRQLEELNRELERRVAERTAELEASAARLRQSEQRRTLALAAGSMGSWDWDMASGECRWDEGQCSIFDVDQASFAPTAENVRPLLHPDDRERVQQTVERAIRSGEPCNAEFRIVRPSGELRWCIGAAAPSLDEAGRAVRLSGVTVDITDRKEAEERQVLLAREVDHRARNALAVVQSILRLSHGRTAEEFIASVDGRIRALARAHTLLSQSRWQGAHLNRLVDEEFAPYRTGDGERIDAQGPLVLLRSATAQAIALALHELATNAAKYGALSSGSGKVVVSWRLEPEWLELRWVETGGPPTAAPAAQGFGTRMIRATLERELGGSVRFDWLGDGLRCELKIPRSQIADSAPRPPAAPRPAERPAQQASSAPSPGQRILLVEDESLIAMMMRDMLVDLGFCVVGPFGDVPAALAAAEADEIQAAVLDVNLNGESVHPVADALAARGVPFLLVTGYDSDSVKERYADIPILQKPIEPTTLQSMLHSLAAAKAAPPRLRDGGERLALGR